MKVKIYVEGGGDGAQLDDVFREGWKCFFEKAGLAGRMPTVVRGKGRSQAFHNYATAVKNRRKSELLLLLLDSEEPVKPGNSVWQHLKDRPQDNFDRPEGSGEGDAFLMVCVMETWFLAYQETLLAFFGSSLNRKALPKWPNLEDVPSERIIRALKNAIRECTKGGYSTGETSFQLLGKIDPAKVEQLPAARRLLHRLRQLPR